MSEAHDRTRQMLERLDEIDRLFVRDQQERDFHERLAAGAAEKAEKVASETKYRFRLIVAVVAAGLLLWTPVVAYGAVWFHELQRNTCYPLAALMEHQPVDEPWHCGLFPGTGRHAHIEGVP